MGVEGVDDPGRRKIGSVHVKTGEHGIKEVMDFISDLITYH